MTPAQQALDSLAGEAIVPETIAVTRIVVSTVEKAGLPEFSIHPGFRGNVLLLESCGTPAGHTWRAAVSDVGVEWVRWNDDHGRHRSATSLSPDELVDFLTERLFR